MHFAGNAGALACIPGSYGVMWPNISQFEISPWRSASYRTLAGEGACVPADTLTFLTANFSI